MGNVKTGIPLELIDEFGQSLAPLDEAERVCDAGRRRAGSRSAAEA